MLDDVVQSATARYRALLLRVGGTFIHLLEKPVYEDRLDTGLQAGLVHIAYSMADLGAARARALAAGAEELLASRRVQAGFGSRDVGCYRSPGGLIFELIKIHDFGLLGDTG